MVVSIDLTRLYHRNYSQHGVHDPGYQNKLTSNLAVAYLQRRQPLACSVVRSPDQDYMHKAHPGKQRYNT